VPMFAGDYWLTAILIPFLVFSLATLGLNILTGYAGQLSLGSAAFMAVGAVAAYNFQLRIPGMPILLSFVLGGVTAALVGMVFGLPSLRIKGFYLAVATLAAQFFIPWLVTKVGWFSNYSASGVISAQPIEILGVPFDTPLRKYLLVLAIVALLALLAKNMVRSAIGRAWMAVRDMDVAAEVIGIRILFMVIIGGVGSILGSFLGAAFITLMPIFLEVVLAELNAAFNLNLDPGVTSMAQLLVFGGLIIFFLIVEPHGLARLWQITKEKLRLWPFPY